MSIQPINQNEAAGALPIEGNILNEDALKIIFSYLGRSLVSAAQTCRHWQKVIKGDSVLYRKYQFALCINSCHNIPLIEPHMAAYPGDLLDLDIRYSYTACLYREINEFLKKNSQKPLDRKNHNDYFVLLGRAHELVSKTHMRALLNLYHDKICDRFNDVYDGESHVMLTKVFEGLFKYHAWVNSSCEKMSVFIDTPHHDILIAASSAFAILSLEFSNFDEMLQPCLTRIDDLEEQEGHRGKIIAVTKQQLLIALANKSIKEVKHLDERRMGKRVDGATRKKKIDFVIEELLSKITTDLLDREEFREGLYPVLKFFVKEGYFKEVRTILEKVQLTNIHNEPLLHPFYLNIKSQEKQLETSKEELLALSFYEKCPILVQLFCEKIEAEVAKELLKEIASQKWSLNMKTRLASWMKPIDEEFADRFADSLFPALINQKSDVFAERMMLIAIGLHSAFPEKALAAYYIGTKFNMKNLRWFESLQKMLFKLGQFKQAKRHLEARDGQISNVAECYSQFFVAYHKSLFPND